MYVFQATLLEMALRKAWGFVIAMIILLVLIYTKFYKDAINSITHEVGSDFEYIYIAPIRNLNYTYIDNFITTRQPNKTITESDLEYKLDRGHYN